MSITLSEEDNKLLKTGNISKMSIFSQNVNIQKIGDYEYYETLDDEIYYINTIHFFNAGFFINKHKQIIFESRYYHTCDFATHLKTTLHTLNYINESDLHNSVFIDKNVLSISKWFVTYGHYVDEAYNLCDVQNKFLLNNISCKVLLDYHTDNEIMKHCPFNTNYKLIDNYLFDKTSVNAYIYGKTLLKMDKLFLIKHRYLDKTFHLFPKYARNKIMDKILNNNLHNKNVFITRNQALHMSRNLSNEPEISSYLQEHNFMLFNPEKISIDIFIDNVRNSDNIVMFWGGALTNMVYFKQGANVIILKSKSYEKESIELFRKIIDANNLNVKIITHVNNEIMMPFLQK
jgi:hypothetical protein